MTYIAHMPSLMSCYEQSDAPRLLSPTATLAPEYAQDLSGMATHAAEQLSHRRDAGAQLRVPNLDGQH